MKNRPLASYWAVVDLFCRDVQKMFAPPKFSVDLQVCV